MIPHASDATTNPWELRDKALSLRESVNSSRARMAAQREQLARLRAEVTVLRELAARGAVAAPPAAAAIPSPLPSRIPAPAAEEAVADSAPATAPFGAGRGLFSARAVPYAAIFLLAVGLQFKPGPRPAAGLPLTAAAPAAPRPAADAPAPAPSAVDDDRAAEALLLAHEWRLPGDETPLSERLGGVDLPGTSPAWSAEPAGERVYRVSYRAPDGSAAYDFDVDLDARRVDPTPETAELLAPRLTAQR